MIGEQIGQSGRRGHLHLILIDVVLGGTFRFGILLLMPERLLVEHGWKLRLERNLSERIDEGNHMSTMIGTHFFHFLDFSFIVLLIAIHHDIVDIATFCFILDTYPCDKRDEHCRSGSYVIVVVGVGCPTAAERSHVKCLPSVICFTAVIQIVLSGGVRACSESKTIGILTFAGMHRCTSLLVVGEMIERFSPTHLQTVGLVIDLLLLFGARLEERRVMIEIGCMIA